MSYSFLNGVFMFVTVRHLKLLTPICLLNLFAQDSRLEKASSFHACSRHTQKWGATMPSNESGGLYANKNNAGGPVRREGWKFVSRAAIRMKPKMLAKTAREPRVLSSIHCIAHSFAAGCQKLAQAEHHLRRRHNNGQLLRE